MTKRELIEQLSQKLRHLSKMEVEVIVDTVFNKMKDALKNKNRVELRGFGIFEVRKRPARLGRNPKSGQTVKVQERYVPFFKVGKELKEKVNEAIEKQIVQPTSTAHVVSNTVHASTVMNMSL